jgi:hypothetical protein
MVSNSTLPPSLRLQHLWPIADQVEHAQRQRERHATEETSERYTFGVRAATPGHTLWESGDGQLWLNQHPGQQRAWDSSRRFVAVLAGLQSGKTSWGPWWLAREIRRLGSGDYIAATASYDLFKLKMLPALRACFERALHWGRYWSGDRIIELADPRTGLFWAERADDPMWARIILRSAESGGGLESTTAKAAWLDEAGQDSFTLDTWHAVRGRLSLARGRCLFTTTVYNLGWLKTTIHDPAKAGDPDIELVQFDSTENPEFPPEEYAEAQASMPEWKFNMRYRGLVERPAGLIYDSFKDFIADSHGAPGHLVPRFALDPKWQRYMGLDFGGVNTVAVLYAEEPGTRRLYLYRAYHAGSRTAKEHAAALLEGEPMVPFCVGGSKSEGQWRREFRMAGLPVNAPDISEVEIGIDRVYGAHKRNEILVFDDLAGYRHEKMAYSRKLDANGEPTEEIENKSTFHVMDAERYIIGRIRRGE